MSILFMSSAVINCKIVETNDRSSLLFQPFVSAILHETLAPLGASDREREVLVVDLDGLNRCSSIIIMIAHYGDVPSQVDALGT